MRKKIALLKQETERLLGTSEEGESQQKSGMEDVVMEG